MHTCSMTLPSLTAEKRVAEVIREHSGLDAEERSLLKGNQVLQGQGTFWLDTGVTAESKWLLGAI